MNLTAAGAESQKAQFQKVSDEYFDQVYFPHQPTAATVAGYHQYLSLIHI